MGKPLKDWFLSDVDDNDIFLSDPRDLWHAKIFPVAETMTESFAKTLGMVISLLFLLKLYFKKNIKNIEKYG